MRLRQPNMLLAAALDVAADFAHRHERRARRAGHLFEHKVRRVAAVPQGHPGPGGPQRPLRDGGAPLRSTEHLAAAAAMQGACAAWGKLDILAHAPWFITRILRMQALVIGRPWCG